MGLKLHNHLRDAIVAEEGHNERMLNIVKLVAREYGKPVDVGIVVGLKEGDPFDFTVSGTMDPDDIARAATHLNFARDLLIRQRADKPSILRPAQGPLAQIPIEAWDALGDEMKRLLLGAAAAGVEVVVHDDPLDDVVTFDKVAPGLDDDDLY